MGCSSSTPKKSASQQAEVSAQAQSPTLTEATAEERALTQAKLIFDSIDANDDHTVSKEKLSDSLKKDESLGALMKDAGLNVKYDLLSELKTKLEGILWEEFLAHLKERPLISAVELPAAEKAISQLKAVFNSIETDGDDAVSKDELAAKLNEDDSVGKLVADAGFNPNFFVLDQLDTKNDGRINWDEFAQNLELVKVAVEEVKETGELSAAMAVQDTGELPVADAVQDTPATQELDSAPAPNCQCSLRGLLPF